MARQLRSDPFDGWHHVMNRGVDRRPIFFADCDRIEFCRLLGSMYDEFGVQIHAYCLLDNHFHLLVRCPDAGLSSAMQMLGSVFTRHVNDRVGRDGPLFRGRFHSRPITTDAYLLAVVRYIHRNALDVEGVDRVDSYRWSSHRTYQGHRRPVDWMVTDFVLDMFGADRAAFARFVSEDASAVVRGTDHIQPCELLEAVDLVIAAHATITRVRSLRRNLALSIAREMDEVTRQALHRALGINHAGTLKSAVWRADRALETQPEIARMLAAVRSLLATKVSVGV